MAHPTYPKARGAALRRVLLALGCIVAACGGQVGTRDSSDGGVGGDSGAAGSSSGFLDSGAAPDSLSSSGGPVDSTAPADTGPDAVTCGIVHDAGSGGVCVPCPGAAPSGACDYNGVACEYPGQYCLCTNGCTSGQCCPKTCEQLGFPCGQVGDGCGGILNCRTCPTGHACGTNGACADPSDAGCVPGGCGIGICGVIDDGCGGKIDCGACYWTCVLSGP